MCQWALAQKRTHGGALERCHGAPFERLAQHGDALGGVGATTQVVKAAELVARQTAHSGECQWALTEKQTLWGGGALQVGDLRLLEDGGERSGAVGSDLVVVETVNEVWGGDGERACVSMGVDRKANTFGWRRT